MKLSIASGLALAALLLAGCARFTPRPLSPAQTAAAFDSGSLTNHDLRLFLETNGLAGEWPRSVWHLRDLVCVAFYYHPDLRLARAQWDSALAAEITAGQRPNPSVTVTPGYDSQIPGAPSPWIVPLSFDLPIETAGKRRYRVARQRQLAESAYWKWIGAIWQTRGNVRTALLNLQAAGRSRRLLDEQSAAQSNVVRLLEGQVAAGAASGFESTQARIAFDTTRLARQEAERQYVQARAQLASALGLPAAALEGAQFADDDLESVPTNLAEPDVRKQALLGRADVRGALAQYAASQTALQLAIAGQYPDIHLGPGYAWNNGSAGDSEWQLGLTVSLPVFNHNQGGVAEAEAGRREAAANFISVQAQAIGQIDGALSGYQAALEELRAAKTLLDELDQRLKSARSMQEAGEADPLSVASAQAEYSTGALSRLDALVKAQQALAQLEDATQSPLTLPERVMRTVQTKHEP